MNIKVQSLNSQTTYSYKFWQVDFTFDLEVLSITTYSQVEVLPMETNLLTQSSLFAVSAIPTPEVW